MICFSIEIEDDKRDFKFGRFIKEKILDSQDLNDDEKNTLLNYPVVYLHSWKGKNQIMKIYIGETIDIERRSEEHEKKAESTDNSWQNNWRAGSNRKSWFFSSSDMNKSLALDIEDRLMKCFDCVNRRDNPQTDYSNKEKSDELLNQIVDKLKTENLPVSNMTSCFSEMDHSKYTDDLAIYYTGINLDDYKNNNKGIVLTSDYNEYQYNQYPIVYIHIWKDGKGRLHTYTGESNDLKMRTEQHEDFFDITDLNDENWHESWKNAKKKIMLVFGHKEMNASVTRDIEDYLIIYTRALGLSVNGRRNPQRCYDNYEKMYPLFKRIVGFLNMISNVLSETLKPEKDPGFKTLDELKEKSAFLASPLIQLSKEQKKVKESIIDAIEKKLKENNKKCQVLIVSGSAGTGKTVITSSIYFDLCDRKIPSSLIVNNKELQKSYKTQSDVRSISTNGEKNKSIFRADQYIKYGKSDVVLVDEAHLLFSDKFMNTIKGSQLQDLAEKSKVLVLMIDPDQYVKSATMWADDLTPENIESKFQNLLGGNTSVEYIVNLTEQFRMNCSSTTADWIKSIPSKGIIPFPYDDSGKYCYTPTKKAYTVTEKNDKGETIYEIRIYNDWRLMARDIEDKKVSDNPSALIASYCWKQNCDNPDNPMLQTVDGYKLFWHKTGSGKNDDNNGIWTLAPTMKTGETAFEVGSFHDIQGFDLNYAGVILGKSIIMKNNCITFALGRKSKKEEGRRDLKESDENWETLIKNEINVLLTRGMKGLYIYAVDDGVRKALIEAIVQTL